VARGAAAVHFLPIRIKQAIKHGALEDVLDALDGKLRVYRLFRLGTKYTNVLISGDYRPQPAQIMQGGAKPLSPFAKNLTGRCTGSISLST